MDEKAKAVELQSRSHQTETEAVRLREQVAKLGGEAHDKDVEIALLRSRENKTIVEHVHVLEKAKKVTDRELAATKRERDELAILVKSLDQHKARLILDIEDMAKQNDALRKQGKTVAGPADFADASAQLASEQKAKAEMEKHIRELEERLQGGVEFAELQKRLKLAEQRNASLEKDLAVAVESKRTLAVPSTTAESRFSTSPSHTRLLQALQLNNEQLKHQMSEELRRGQLGVSPAGENESPDPLTRDLRGNGTDAAERESRESFSLLRVHLTDVEPSDGRDCAFTSRGHGE